MASVIPTTESDVLTAVKARLIAAVTINGTAIASNRVLIVARDSVPHFGATNDILIRGGDASNGEAAMDGMGREATFVRQTFEITVRTRMFLDQADRDGDWLTKASTGHSTVCHTILNTLHKWTATSGDNLLLAEPMVFDRWAKPRRQPHRGTPRGWGERVMLFSARYLLSLEAGVE